MRHGSLILALIATFLASSAHAQRPGATLPGFPPPPGPVSLREGPEPPPGGQEPIVSVTLQSPVQSGFLVLVEPGTTNDQDPHNWSDVVVFSGPTHGVACQAGDAAQVATLVSESAGETGMSDTDLAPAGISIAQILACPQFTVFQVEGTQLNELNVYSADAATVYYIYSDADATLNPTHFWSYQLLSPAVSPTPIALRDQLYAGFRPFVVDTLKRLVNWVIKNNSAVSDTFTHYAWWNIHEKRPVGALTDITNQFGSGRIYLANVEFLLAPAWKNTDFPNTPTANHYLCYRASGWRPEPIGYDMRDEWRSDVQPPDTLAFFCLPCAKQHGSILYAMLDSVTDLAVYRIKPQSEPFFPFIKDQFLLGNHLVQQLPDEYLFVPSLKGDVVGVEPRPEVPLNLALKDPAPNPAHVSATLLFTLPRAMPVRLEVYDVFGRRVRELVRGTLDPGPHETAWDLRNAMGDRVRSGIYIVRLAAGGVRLSRRLIVTN